MAAVQNLVNSGSYINDSGELSHIDPYYNFLIDLHTLSTFKTITCSEEMGQGT